MAKRVAELLGRLLLPPADVASIDDHVVLVGHSINVDDTELKVFELHGSLFVWRESIALVNHAANDTTNAVVPERLSQAVGRVGGDAERTLRLSDTLRNNI